MLEGKAAAMADALVPLEPGRHGAYLAAHTECNEGDLDPDGRLLLCSEAGHAAVRAFRHAGSGELRLSQRRRLSGVRGGGEIPSYLIRPALSRRPGRWWPVS